MSNAPAALKAFIDESYDSRNRDEPVYVLAAVILQGALPPAREQVKAVSLGGDFHATELKKSGNADVIDTMLHTAVRLHQSTVIVAHTPYTGSTEPARQSCLSTLAIELNTMGVYNLTADDRRLAVSTHAGDLQKLNKNDQATIAGLKKSGHVQPHMMLEHRADKWEQLLWLPDAIAWSARRHLSAGDSQQWALIADHCHLVQLNQHRQIINRSKPSPG